MTHDQPLVGLGRLDVGVIRRLRLRLVTVGPCRGHIKGRPVLAPMGTRPALTTKWRKSHISTVPPASAATCFWPHCLMQGSSNTCCLANCGRSHSLGTNSGARVSCV